MGDGILAKSERRRPCLAAMLWLLKVREEEGRRFATFRGKVNTLSGRVSSIFQRKGSPVHVQLDIDDRVTERARTIS